MKKIIIASLFVTVGVFSLTNIAPAESLKVYSLQKYSAMTLGYDKSMSEKTIKAAVIDSYFRNLCQNGNLIRWNKSSMPLKVYIEDAAGVPEYYRDVVISAYQSWQRASEGLVSFEFVESANEANTKCYFRPNDNKYSIGTLAFSVNGNTITNSTIIFNTTDNKGFSHDSKQLYSSALQEIGHSLGLTGKSPSIYDVMYPIGTKFNTEITPRDLKTLALMYSVIPDIIDRPLTLEQKSMLMTANDVLSTLNVPVNDDTNLQEVQGSDISTHLALAEQYRKRAEYSKAVKEYQIVAQMKSDRRSKSEVYYEVAVMYLDAEEFDNA